MAITEQERERVARLVKHDLIGPMPSGPLLDHFDPIRMAEGLEEQALRAKLLFDVPVVDLRMGADDAIQLAAWLRQAPRKD